MEARYPNTPPSPSDMYAAYKDLPHVPGGMQALQNIVNQHKNDGLPNGSIALSILNAANQAQVPPPMPQGTVADQVVAQAAPPIDPNMLGLAAPGLEQYAQEQQMAMGGLVALAGGGPVQGYASKGEVNFSDPDIDWGRYGEYEPLPGADEDTGLLPPSLYELRGPRVGRGGIPAQDVLDQTRETFTPETVATRGRGAIPTKETSSSPRISELREALDLANTDVSLPQMPERNPSAVPVSFSPGIPSASSAAVSPTVIVDTEDGGIPAARPAADERTTGGTSAKVPELSADAQIDALAKFYEGDHSKAAELKGQLEKRLASKENKDLITDIATGLGMMFSGQGTKTQAMGQGLMAFASQRGRSGEAQDKLQGTIDAMVLQDEAQRNAARHAAAQTVFGAKTKSAQQYQDFLYNMALKKQEGRDRIAAWGARGGSGTDPLAIKAHDIMAFHQEVVKAAMQSPEFMTAKGDRAAEDAVIKKFEERMMPPQYRDYLPSSVNTTTAQPSYNLPAGYGYTPG